MTSRPTPTEKVGERREDQREREREGDEQRGFVGYQKAQSYLLRSLQVQDPKWQTLMEWTRLLELSTVGERGRQRLSEDRPCEKSSSTASLL